MGVGAGTIDQHHAWMSGQHAEQQAFGQGRLIGQQRPDAPAVAWRKQARPGIRPKP